MARSMGQRKPRMDSLCLRELNLVKVARLRPILISNTAKTIMRSSAIRKTSREALRTALETQMES